MDILVLASSSRGNCYALRCGDSVLLLEAGIPVSKLRKLLPVGLACVEACLVTHEHQDHAGYVRQYEEAGIPVYASMQTCGVLGIGKPVIRTKKWSFRCHDVRLGGWRASMFSVRHDAADPVGYLIDAPDGTRVCFAIDTYLLPYKFPGVNVWMLECNYDLEMLQANIDEGVVDEAQAKRILQSHMSVDHVCEFLIHQDLRGTEAVYLLHGSGRNLDAEKACSRVRAAVGRPVYMGVNV